MPKRTDLESILIVGSGPIVIGQACEFDYSGTQACRVLRDEGYRVVLVNSNPATIMTDPDFADATYVEPLDVASLRRIIERERPDALLPTLGGQTALNLAIELDEAGVLEEFGVELIGASIEAIHTAEDRSRFKVAMHRDRARRCRSRASPTRWRRRCGSARRWASRSSAGRASSSAAAAPASRTTSTSCARSRPAASPRARSTRSCSSSRCSAGRSSSSR